MPKVEWKGDQILAQAEKAAMDGAEEWARVDVLPLADENCPTDSGTMKGTHAVLRTGPLQIEIGYGGAAAAYTERQHEDLTLSHPSGEAKWLENAFNAKQSELSEKVRSRVAGVLK
jgi:hypothetical protein